MRRQSDKSIVGIREEALNYGASPTLIRFAKTIATEAMGTILDVPCGYGRNAKLMASLGCSVICLDNDPDALAHIGESSLSRGNLEPVFFDLKKDRWNFAPNQFGAILNIHLVMPELFEYLKRSLMPGGFLFIETYDNRGGNYLALPKQGEYRKLLSPVFDLLYYVEKKAGPIDVDACTVRLLAKKERTGSCFKDKTCS